MGNIEERIRENKFELALGSVAGLLSLVAYFQRKDTSELRRIANSIDPYIPTLTHQLQ